MPAGVTDEGWEPVGATIRSLQKPHSIGWRQQAESQVLYRSCVKLVIDRTAERYEASQKRRARIKKEAKQAEQKAAAERLREKQRLDKLRNKGTVRLGSFDNIGKNEAVVRLWIGKSVEGVKADGSRIAGRLVGISGTAVVIDVSGKRSRIEMFDLASLTRK